MFESDIEVLKKELESLVLEYGKLESELTLNNKQAGIVKELRFCRDDFLYCKNIFTKVSLVAVLTVLVANLLVLFTVPVAFIVTLIFSTITALIPTAVTLLAYLDAKVNYKNIATRENLELESNIENIDSNIVELNANCNKYEEVISEYSELIGYLTDYDYMIDCLSRLKEKKSLEYKKMFDDYLNEKADYSKVHFNGPFELEKVPIKKLTNK